MLPLITILITIIFTVLGAPQSGGFDGRIVGGIPTTIEEYPYQASIQRFGYHICGATIISNRHIITAAHCTDRIPPERLTVRVGSSYRERGGRVYQVKEIHQNRNFTLQTMDYDISIIVLETPLEFSTTVVPIPLVFRNTKISSGTELIITGWGTLRENGESPQQLQMVEIPYIDNKRCQKSYKYEKITERMLCAGTYYGDKDSCQGDSGGPVVADGRLVGVVSWGYGCAQPEYPGVYTRLSEVRDFIANVTGF